MRRDLAGLLLSGLPQCVMVLLGSGHLVFVQHALLGSGHLVFVQHTLLGGHLDVEGYSAYSVELTPSSKPAQSRLHCMPGSHQLRYDCALGLTSCAYWVCVLGLVK